MDNTHITQGQHTRGTFIPDTYYLCLSLNTGLSRNTVFRVRKILMFNLSLFFSFFFFCEKDEPSRNDTLIFNACFILNKTSELKKDHF